MQSVLAKAGAQRQNGVPAEAETGRGVIRSRKRAGVMARWGLDRRCVMVCR